LAKLVSALLCLNRVWFPVEDKTVGISKCLCLIFYKLQGIKRKERQKYFILQLLKEADITLVSLKTTMPLDVIEHKELEECCEIHTDNILST
jgi:hypothetical protein